MQEQVVEKRAASWFALVLGLVLLFYLVMQTVIVLQVVGVFLSLIALLSFVSDIKVFIGLSGTKLVAPDAHRISLLLVYIVAVVAMFLHYPVWAAVLTPWLMQAIATNIMGGLVAAGLIEIINTDEEE